ncbi:60S ribosomal protein L4-1 [Dendrobium catenatum]|uniref:60S ribosomal protein L4-1 n=1 Tax=Dendrobium catenatum TaxID=906689 RepID=A0A2I0VN04_9ASPA|nr:60S ribosomal protein L4-1 [Dendrobium catenatum]
MCSLHLIPFTRFHSPAGIVQLTLSFEEKTLCGIQHQQLIIDQLFARMEVSFVLLDSVESIEKTSSAIKILKQVGAYADAEKAMGSFGIRPGKGKMRNRRYISRKGTLNVYETEGSIS